MFRESRWCREDSERTCAFRFGKILRGKVVPNTVTKTLHTDKVYDPELKEKVDRSVPVLFAAAKPDQGYQVL